MTPEANTEESRITPLVSLILHILYVFTAIAVVVIAGAGIAIVVNASGPQPGDVMALMGMPYVCAAALITAVFSFATGFISARPKRFTVLAVISLLSGTCLFVMAILVEHVFR